MLKEDVFFNYESFKNYYSESELLDFLNELLPYINRKKYNYINEKGDNIKKSINPALFALYFLMQDRNNEEYLKIIFNNIWKDEKIKIKEIKRFSNLSIEDVEKNLFKTMVKNENVYSLSYGKELLLRDSHKFFKMILFYSMINDNSIYNTSFALFAKDMIIKLGSRKNFLFPFYIVISFFSSDIPDFTLYKMSLDIEKYKFNENYQNIINEIIDNIDILKNDKEKLYSYFNILKNISENYNEENAGKKYFEIKNYIKVLSEYIENYFDEKTIYFLIKAYIMLDKIDNLKKIETLDSVDKLILKL